MTTIPGGSANRSPLRALLESAGAEWIELPVLHPAEPFLETAGEDIRRRMFVTEGPAGERLALRPDFTIPVCLAHMASGAGAARYAYQGTVFRRHDSGSPERLETGYEDIGRNGEAAADAEALALGVAAVAMVAAGALTVRLGDIALFAALLDALKLPAAWQRKLRRSFGVPELMAANLARLSAPRGIEDTRLGAELRAAAERHDRAGLAELLAEELAAHGHSEGAGRAPEDIAERFLDQRALAETHLDADAAGTLDAFLKLSAPLAEAERTLRDFCKARRVDLGAALSVFDERAREIAAREAGGACPLRGRVRPAARLLYGPRLRHPRRRHTVPRRGRRPLRPADAHARRRARRARRRLHHAPRPSRPQGLGMSEPIVLGLPSKGRLKQEVEALLEQLGLGVKKRRSRQYHGRLTGIDGVEIAYLSSAEIARELGAGKIHLGITGEDLLRETLADPDRQVSLLAPLGFGQADVVVAVPEHWIDVWTMEDLDDVAAGFAARHGRRLRIATKYWNLTQRFFSSHGIALYRVVESLGATEGAPAAGTADLIVDITTTGSTLAANHLKVLEDGIILRSQAHLVSSRAALADGIEPAPLRELLTRLRSAGIAPASS